MPNSQGIVQTNPMNKTQGRHVHSYSTFAESLSYRLANTLRFGEYTPSFVMEGVENDEIQVNSKDLIDSLSLKAPFKGSIRKIKESFKVPLMSILPLNWDRIYVQPSNGDDVPVNANCVLPNFPARMSEFWLTTFTTLFSNVPASTDSSTQMVNWLTAFLRTMVLGEYIYSNGSLLNVCGYKASAQFWHPNFSSYDEFFDYIVSRVFSEFKCFQVATPPSPNENPILTIYLGLASGASYTDDQVSSFRSLLETFRENPLSYFYGTGFLEYKTNFADAQATIAGLSSSAERYVGDYSKIKFVLPSAASSFDIDTDITALNPNSLNLSRILAYQLVCAHFYSNSSVDVIYSAELYRQYIKSLYDLIFPNTNPADPQGFWVNQPTFMWNGLRCPYDYLSGACLSNILFLSGSSIYTFTYAQLSSPFDGVTNYQPARFAVFAAVFGFRKSLRYGDYFVGSRPRPLAPINTDVAVNSNQVSVIDITRGIQAQRFANSVMRSRQKIEEYVKSLFGKAPAPDYHNPFFLTRESEIIYGDEVQNTADAQQTDANSRTSNFSSSMNQYTFTFHNDDEHPCIYLQIISFDVKRYYTRSVERQFLHLDRFDMFNPDFQFIGDQPIHGIELGYPRGGYIQVNLKFPDNFAYTTRDMEYKQRFDQASGGFVTSLPGWILTDKDLSKVSRGYLDPDFIRSYNTELDQFFLSLSGFSLGTYFHFICITNNFVNAKRPMAVDPQILG